MSDSALNLRARLQIVWGVTIYSTPCWYVLALLFGPDDKRENSTTAVILLCLVTAASALGVWIRLWLRKRAIDRHDPAKLREGYIYAIVLSQLPAVTGFGVCLLTGWVHYWMFFVISIVSFAVNFPTRAAVATDLDSRRLRT